MQATEPLNNAFLDSRRAASTLPAATDRSNFAARCGASLRKADGVALALLLLLAASTPAHALVTAEQVDRLGKSLTPMGAERAANKAGSIPPWEGGLTKPPAGFDAAKGLLDPFAADKALYTITGDNAQQYKDRLAPGQLELLKRYPNYKMIVYPSHRTAGYPAAVYEAVKREAASVELENEGNAVKHVKSSRVPFPLPQTGVEVMWNNVFRYRGNSFIRNVAEFPVQASGAFTPVKREEMMLFGTALEPPVPNLLFAYRTQFKAPANVAGDVILVHELIDQVRQPRAAWMYSPGTRRVVRAPEIGHDQPRVGTDGLSTVDDYDGFTGSPDRFNWKLVGKREMLVSYNNYRLTDKSLKYADIVRPGTMNQELLRYELHRVWVVEGSLKTGKGHAYSKRVYFIDEDSWQVAHGDLYDGRGELWRVIEQHGIQYYDAPCFWIAGSAQYDLQSRRYVVSGLTNEEKPLLFDVQLKSGDFTSDALRRAGN